MSAGQDTLHVAQLATDDKGDLLHEALLDRLAHFLFEQCAWHDVLEGNDAEHTMERCLVSAMVAKPPVWMQLRPSVGRLHDLVKRRRF